MVYTKIVYCTRNALKALTSSLATKKNTALFSDIDIHIQFQMFFPKLLEYLDIFAIKIYMGNLLESVSGSQYLDTPGNEIIV